MTIPSPKTEHQNKPYRLMPIFPELRWFLEGARDEAPSKATFVVNRYRESSQNLRTQFLRILRRAELQPWELLFHNLRASRQADIADQFSLHVSDRLDWEFARTRGPARSENDLKTTDQHIE